MNTSKETVRKIILNNRKEFATHQLWAMINKLESDLAAERATQRAALEADWYMRQYLPVRHHEWSAKHNTALEAARAEYETAQRMAANDSFVPAAKDAAELRKALEEMYDAMLRYQSDAETEAPAAHRQMMHRTRMALGIEPNDRAARALKGQP